jgi:hypothetical protein
MNRRHATLSIALVISLFQGIPSPEAHAAADETTVTEVAPGVFFRKAQTEPVFTGCNQGFVVFRDFVLVIDANFPGQVDEVIAAIREKTDKPIRFVFDTHYHGDHADGNVQYMKVPRKHGPQNMVASPMKCRRSTSRTSSSSTTVNSGWS